MEHLPTKTPYFCTCIFIMKKNISGIFLKHIPLFVLVNYIYECRKSEKKSFISSILKSEREEKSIEFLKSLSINFIRKSSEKTFGIYRKNIDINKKSYLITASLDI